MKFYIVINSRRNYNREISAESVFAGTHNQKPFISNAVRGNRTTICFNLDDAKKIASNYGRLIRHVLTKTFERKACIYILGLNINLPVINNDDAIQKIQVESYFANGDKFSTFHENITEIYDPSGNIFTKAQYEQQFTQNQEEVELAAIVKEAKKLTKNTKRVSFAEPVFTIFKETPSPETQDLKLDSDDAYDMDTQPIEDLEDNQSPTFS